jgi:hypothetical protein
VPDTLDNKKAEVTGAPPMTVLTESRTPASSNASIVDLMLTIVVVSSAFRPDTWGWCSRTAATKSSAFTLVSMSIIS